MDPAKLYVSAPFETVLGVYSVNLTRLILDRDGKFAGIVTATLDPDFFATILRAVLFAPDMQTGIASQDGIIFFNLPEIGSGLGRNIAVPGSIFTKHRGTGQAESVWSGRALATGDDRLVVVRDALSPDNLDKPVNFATSRKLDAMFGEWIEKATLLGILYVAFSIASFIALYGYQKNKEKSESRIRLLSSIVEQSPISVVVTSRDGAIDYVNKAFSETTGYSLEEVLGKNPRVLQSGHTSPETYRDLWTTLLRGEAWRGEFLNRIKSGATIWESVAIFPIRDEVGNASQYVAIKENVTKGKEIQTELVDAKERAEASNKAKSTFLAMMSHELRTPLNAVIGFAEMMRKQTLGPLGRPQYVEYAEDIEKSGRHLLEVLNDMLDLAKLETGGFKPDLQAQSLVKIVKSLASIMTSMATDSGHAMTFDIGYDAHVACDRRGVRQILLNLVSNAAKYTKRGGEIRVGVVQRPDGKVDLSVTDNGIGMAARDIRRSMDLFTRLDHGMARMPEGVGIGLYMVRRLAEEMNAALDLRSELGAGTTVTVTFNSVNDPPRSR